MLISDVPQPGETFVFEDGNVTLNRHVQYFSAGNIIACYVDYDDDNNILNTSYVDLYHDQENKFGNLTIGSILLINEFIMFDLPSNCTTLVAAKIVDIVHDFDNLIRLYVKQANLFEYIDSIDVNSSNATSYDNSHIHEFFQDSGIVDIDYENENENENIINATYDRMLIFCTLQFDNGTIYKFLNISVCEENIDSMYEQFAHIYDDDYDVDDGDSRRRGITATW